LVESCVNAVRSNVFVLFRLPRWIARGRAYVKRELAARGRPDVASLPYRQDVLEFLRAERGRGRTIVLASACEDEIGRAVAAELGFFDDVLASDGRCNLKGSTKLAAIREYCAARGHQGFAYIGDSKADLPVWEAAQQRYAVSPSQPVECRLRELGPVELVFHESVSLTSALIAALRPDTWVVNLLVFLPLMLVGGKGTEAWWNALQAFVSLSCMASAGEVIGGIFSAEAERRQPRRGLLPFADGQLPLAWGPPIAVALVAGAGLSAVGLPMIFLVVALLYLVAVACNRAWRASPRAVAPVTSGAVWAFAVAGGIVALNSAAWLWLAGAGFLVGATLQLATCPQCTD
ncbi:MAG: haloacid dehalogenase-like hydrolase, partial [Planctomycetota bacterium]